MFSALSRLQNEPQRLRNYFPKGYGLFLSLVMPITITSALCAEDIVRVFLGSKWALAAPTVRFLAPTILTIGLLYPLGTLLFSIEKGMRSLKIALLTAPVVILAEMVGLRYGPLGIAAGLSVATALLVLPVIFWAAHKTPVSAGEMLREILRPLLSSLIAAGTLLACTSFLQPLSSPLLRLIVANTLLFGVHFIILLFAMGQMAIYLPMLRDAGLWPVLSRRRRIDTVPSQVRD